MTGLTRWLDQTRRLIRMKDLFRLRQRGIVYSFPKFFASGEKFWKKMGFFHPAGGDIRSENGRPRNSYE